MCTYGDTGSVNNVYVCTLVYGRAWQQMPRTPRGVRTVSAHLGLGSIGRRCLPEPFSRDARLPGDFSDVNPKSINPYASHPCKSWSIVGLGSLSLALNEFL